MSYSWKASHFEKADSHKIPARALPARGEKITSAGLNAGLVNAMTVDVEDYFQVSAFESYVDRKDWCTFKLRVEKNTDRILDMFSASDVKATFFVLGWVAKRYPGMVERIVAEGHELASHGWDHVRVVNHTREQFSADVRRTMHLLEDMSGVQVKGYRAPSYSINASNDWAHDALQEAGYLYSSSIAPIKHDLYGIPDAPRFAHRRGSKGILEVPVSTVVIAGRNVPCGGGGWFRLYPYALSRWAINQVNSVEKQSSVFYFHPWEIDPGQPRQAGIDRRTRFRHYINLASMESKVNALLHDFSWNRMDRIFLNSHMNEGQDFQNVADRLKPGN